MTLQGAAVTVCAHFGAGLLVPLQGVASVVRDLVLIIYLKLKINLRFVFTKAAILSFDACHGVMPGIKICIIISS